jgi:ATP-dependent RNA helicase UAP56/SUB2
MSHGKDNEELIDYEDEHDFVPNGTAASTSNGATGAVDGEGVKDKKNFSGIHSTGFRCVLLFSTLFPAQRSCTLKGLLVEA